MLSLLTDRRVIGLVENPAHWTLVDAQGGQVIVNQFEAMAVHGPLGGEGKGEKGSRLNCESH
ncbi:hypothetical protein NC653_002498 [Populus alba x Populus x berolinensis]|uniref:Uncharacterized protein n=1 Tax=Populus alba x Populus x berolinensis TaxID=444605 RepID=A0AAD6RQQ0_9ROSI|nr:hypothetical protein NC653_002498 [Populus alba x Populus x berolinensis]